jgi:hypothetical protein
MDKTAKRHLDTINSGLVAKTQVIGIRKILAHTWRIGRGYSGNRCNATADDAAALVEALDKVRPVVDSALYESGRKALQDKRYKRRWHGLQAAIVADVEAFALVGFHDYASGAYTPVYEARAKASTSATMAACRPCHRLL